jgi:predicted ferric reductase
MTAANQRVAPTGQPGRRGAPSVAHPATTARVVLWAVVVANLVVVELLYVTQEPAKNTLVAIGQFLGLHAGLFMIAQLLLVARLPWLERRIGMDRLTSWHRVVGFTLFWTVLLHPTFVMLGYARFDHASFLKEFSNLAGIVGTLLGMFAAGIVVIAAGLSIRFARRRLGYETWHTIHTLLYVAVVLAMIHQLYEGSTFKRNAVTTFYWWTLWTLALLALLIGRLVIPVIRNARHGLRVQAVVPESDNVVSVYVTGRGLDRMPARAGQFFIWRFLSRGRWWQANPFSLSAAPDGQRLRLTAKAVGATSAGLRDLPVGTRVYAEGPYGAFTTLHQTRDATLLIAGGVGVTPIRALLEELTGSIVVLYRVRSLDDAVLLTELQDLARERGAQLHVLPGRTSAGNNPFGAANLQTLVPDLVDRDIFVCGPPAMTSAVLRSLRTLRVPRQQVHAEQFSLAG